MIRVLLFADLAGATLSDFAGRPVACGAMPNPSRCVDKRRHVESTILRRWCSLRQHRIANKARRWWLVECENAAAGRYIIAGGVDPRPNHGRILAQGGAA